MNSLQVAIERVRPAVIGAIENVPAARALCDGSRAMAANVAERAKNSGIVADNDDGFANNFRGEEGFRISDGAFHTVHFPAILRKGSNQLPGATEDALALEFHHGGVDVEAGGKRLRTFQVFIDVEAKRIDNHAEKLAVHAEKFQVESMD
jgi:hypothetical protein